MATQRNGVLQKLLKKSWLKGMLTWPLGIVTTESVISVLIKKKKRMELGFKW